VIQRDDGSASVDSGVDLLGSMLRPLGTEAVSLHSAVDRVLGEDVIASVDVPAFDRSAMDGYAVQASATEQATANRPVIFTVLGDSLPGRPFAGKIEPGETVRIMTGAPIPASTDAVAPVETIDELLDGVPNRIAISKKLSAGQNVGHRGEDIRSGHKLFQAGRILRPQDVGVLALVGASPVRVVRRLRVTVLPGGFQSPAAECCTILIASMLREESLTPTVVRRESMYDPRFRLAPTDVIISVGTEDVAETSPKDCQIGIADGVPVIALPSNPWGCQFCFQQILVPAIRSLELRTLRSVLNVNKGKR